MNNVVLMYEKELVDRLFTNKALLYYRAAVNRLELDCRMRELPYTRSGFIMLMTGSLLTKIMEWMNGKVMIVADGTSLLQEKDMIQYLDALLCSHTTGLTMEEFTDVLKVFGAVVPLLQRVRWVSENLLAFPIVGRGNDESST